jgi:ATP-dependent helicase Lhr and Lhr-like helicase
MTTLRPSSFDEDASRQTSEAFGRLHELVRRWVWERGWTALRDIQEEAITPILEGGRDIIIAAATAAGKTEAAFLPICSKIVESPLGSVRALYISPLKALINDQFSRLEELCEHLDIPVHRWHGDVSSGHKREVLSNPAGILLITPESLEALFVLRGTAIAGLFGKLDFVVVDELHTFIGTERGQQLQSLLSRMELVARRRIPRVALSATLGDMELATEFLRPDSALPCQTLVSTESGQDLHLQLRGYRIKPPEPSKKEKAASEGPEDGSGISMVAAHLFNVLRGQDNLIFVNSRQNVELYADHLRRLCEQAHLPNEFWPHHGNLSRDLREDAETALKDHSLPTTVVCTTTLELGIDIGNVATIAQVGVPPMVSSLRQRLGRSGRRGEPAVLRIYIQELDPRPDSAPQDYLREKLVQTVAMVRLLLDKWCEPPTPGALHLSTLVQQVLSLIAQYGGCKANEAWRALCREGAFRAVSENNFVRLLRNMGKHDLVVQSSDGTILLGVKGERIVNHYSFYTVFVVPEEYRLVSEGQELGTLPITHPLSEGGYLIFAGRRWAVLRVDAERRVVELKPAPAGAPPRFSGEGGEVHERVRQEMKTVYESTEVPVFLDTTAQALLREAREAYADYRLDRSPLVEYGGRVALFFWAGDRVIDTILLQLQSLELEVERHGMAVIINKTSKEALVPLMRTLAGEGPADAIELASLVKNKLREKYHCFLDEELLSQDYASSRLDPEGAWQALLRVVAAAEGSG